MFNVELIVVIKADFTLFMYNASMNPNIDANNWRKDPIHKLRFSSTVEEKMMPTMKNVVNESVKIEAIIIFLTETFNTGLKSCRKRMINGIQKNNTTRIKLSGSTFG